MNKRNLSSFNGIILYHAISSDIGLFFVKQTQAYGVGLRLRLKPNLTSKKKLSSPVDPVGNRPPLFQLHYSPQLPSLQGKSDS